MLAPSKKTLRRSFCGKTDKDVARLVAGPFVYICDGCIETCNKILEATPSTFAGWDKMTSQDRAGGFITPSNVSSQSLIAIISRRWSHQ